MKADPLWLRALRFVLGWFGLQVHREWVVVYEVDHMFLGRFWETYSVHTTAFDAMTHCFIHASTAKSRRRWGVSHRVFVSRMTVVKRAQ